MTAAKEYCMDHPAIVYASRNSGLAIHGIVETASTSMFTPFREHGLAQPPTASTVSALTTPPEGGHTSAFGEAVYTLTNA